MKNERRHSSFEVFVGFSGLLVALFSLYIAYQANLRAEEANRIAQEANDLSRENNRLAILGTTATVQIRRYDYPEIYAYGCQENGHFRVVMLTEQRLIFSNIGGRSISLDHVKLVLSRLGAWGEIRSFDQQQQIEPPVDIPPGVSRSLRFIATEFVLGDTEDEAKNLFSNAISQIEQDATGPIWTFKFSDDSTIDYTLQRINGVTVSDFEHNCADLYNANSAWLQNK